MNIYMGVHVMYHIATSAMHEGKGIGGILMHSVVINESQNDMSGTGSRPLAAE